MAFSTVNIASTAAIIPVDTRVIPKVLYLPTVSTNAGRYLLFKDYYGTSSNSTFTISTTGTDLLDDYNFKYTFSNDFGSISFMSDGLRSWRTLDLYNGALTPGSPPYVTSGLVYFLDAGNTSSYPGSGSTWTDLMGTGKNITLYNSPTYSSANGGYLTFANASSQYGECGTSLNYMSNYSIEVWHYYTGYSGTNPCIVTEVWPGATSRIAYCLGNATGSMPIVQNAFFTGAWQSSAGWTPTVNNWYHIIGTYDGSNLRLYVNNSNVVTTANTTTVLSNSGGFRLMRRWDTGDYWGGRLAIYRVYNRALTTSEVNQNYNNGAARFGL